MADRLVAVNDADYRLPDPVLAAIAADVADTSTVIGGQVSTTTAARYAPLTFFVDEFAVMGDASDANAWARALAAARTFASASVVEGGARRYEFAGPVGVQNTQNVTIRGASNGRTVLASKSGVLASIFQATSAHTGTIRNLVIEDLHIDGGMVPMAAGLARDDRVFGSTYIDVPISISGNRTPGGASWSDIDGITIRRVSIFGCKHLPISIRGAVNVNINDCDFERTLDVGVTFTQGVTVSGNRSRWSGDNGFSVSRGNTDCVVSNNRVFGCWFWGIWLAGWTEGGVTFSGPSGFTCTGNMVNWAGSGGITVHLAGRNGTISGNTVIAAVRGGAGTGDLGIGIYVFGNGEGSDYAWSDNLTITANTLIDCARGGILVRAWVKNLVISSNEITRPGTEKDHTGATISATDGLQNFGVSVYSVGTEFADGKFGQMIISDNLSVDDRTVPYMNYGVFTSAGMDTATVARHGNRTSGARTDYIDFEPLSHFAGINVGRSNATQAIINMNGASSAGRALVFQQNGSTRQAIRQLDTGGLYFTSYTDAGAATNWAKVNRTTHALEYLTPPKNAVYTTAGRPSAATFGLGSQIYDSDLKVPLWSDGTVWRNAASVAV